LLQESGLHRTTEFFGGRLINHIHENPVETEEHLIAIISSMCVNIQKYARYICAVT